MSLLVEGVGLSPWNNKLISQIVGFFFKGLGKQKMEHLTQLWTCLTLFEREGPGCCLTSEDSSNVFSIVAKFITKRALTLMFLSKLLPLCGEHILVSQHRGSGTTKSFSLLITKKMLIEL